MGAFLTVRLDDLKVRAQLQAAQARGRDMRPVLQDIGRFGVRQTRRRFELGVGPDGRSWKKSRKPSGLTLVASGLLLRSISDRPPTATSVSWGSNLLYAPIHQAGGVIVPVKAGALRFRIGGNGGWVMAKRVVIPARPYLGINDQDLSEYAEVLLHYLAEPLGGGAA